MMNSELKPQHYSTGILIPARYGSTRLPAKPLLQIGNDTLVGHVIARAKEAREQCSQPETVFIAVLTDDERIQAHVESRGVPAVLTPETCATGTDRIAAGIEILAEHHGITFDIVLNLQGDAPLTPPEFLLAIMDGFKTTPADIITATYRLGWDELTQLRERKKVTPFSGTTVAWNPNSGQAYWFSKNIIPGIRQEQELRKTSEKSPVFMHVGLYGYRAQILPRLGALADSTYETLEGLEQLRWLESGLSVRVVEVPAPAGLALSGVDSPEDVARILPYVHQAKNSTR